MPALSSLPIVAALDHLEAPLDRVSPTVVEPILVLSLVEALSAVPDPRKPRGVRHGVLAVLLLGACAVLAGARSFAAVAEYAHDAGHAVLDVVGAGVVVPHELTIRRVLQQLDAGALEAALQTWVLAQLAARAPTPGIPAREQRRVFAFDGKTVRGARSRATSGGSGTDGDEPVAAPHLVSVIDQATGAVLGQVQVDGKGSEIAAFTTLLDQLELREVLISADALHTQRAHARYLHERGGHYLLTVKANQPTLLRRMRALPWSQIDVAARQQARGHGRVETRAITVVSLERCPDLGGEFFPHAAQAIKLVRRRRPLDSRTWTTVTVYAITSLTAFQADPALLAQWIRGHWAIEALHWVRDVSFDEDRSQVRTRQGPQVMAALRNLAITALRLSGATNIAAALRHHARDTRRPLDTYKIT